MEEWANPELVDPADRDRLMTEILETERKTDQVLWPSAAMEAREEMAGLYPDPADPQFAARLYEKREFYEARAVVAGVAEGTVDPCTSAAAEAVFELTPVQRIVSRFLSPQTPYMGMLLYHGVGVGKTCSAVTIAEQFLETSPNTKVIVLVPQALKENFKRTVFDPSKLVWGDGHWASRQCTGTSYLERLDLMTNPDLRQVTYRVDEDRRARYTVTGYQAFANWIDRTLKKSVPAGLTDPATRAAAENEVLRRLFSDHLIIVDEAHNLRDLAAGESADAVVAGETAENQGGKMLNPFLKRIVLNAEGLRLVFMTATPMYNSAPEIMLLLNYLYMNDMKSTKAEKRPSDIFTKSGEIIPGRPQRYLEMLARRYVSYMRGENPYTFPLRMRPLDASADAASMWPVVGATKAPVVITGEDAAAINALPLVFTEPVEGSPVELQLRAATGRGGAFSEGEPGGDAMLDTRMQIANISYPDSMFGTGGFDYYFSRQLKTGGGHKLRTFAPKGFDVDSIFTGDGLRTHAPKIHRIVESIKAARGICFAYSRYIKAGALPLAIALERAGFQRRLADGRLAPVLSGVPAVPATCAICGARAHDAADHPFKPACYILLTSEDDISPNFAGLVRQATSWPDDPEYGPLGSNVKVIIGSQVASEGLDLKCVREMHILDSWYHLNRTDQIIGRAIRYCSHTALREVEKRTKTADYPDGLPLMALNNCLIYLHVVRMPDTTLGPAFETADMYAYRLAIGKAQMVGKVQRILKKNAWDCNLEMEAITFVGLDPRIQIDAQGNDRRSLDEDGEEMDGYSINDVDYTTYCDYQRCHHECAVTVENLKLDTSTFGVADARRLILAKQSIVRRLFDGQVMVPESVVKEIFSDLPWEISSEALLELIDGRRFSLRRPDGVEGFLVKKAGYLVFQPSAVTDTDIPISMRYARAFQLRRHFMEPRLPVLGRAEEAGPVKPAPVPGLVPGPGLGPAPGPGPLMSKWAEWLSYVNSGGVTDSGLPKILRLWKWILGRYAALPETRQVALRWWFDKQGYAEQRALIELATAPTDAVGEALAATVASDIFRSKSLVAYRVFNPVTASTELLCRTSAAAAFSLCAGQVGSLTEGSIAGIVSKSLGDKPVLIQSDAGQTGPLIGFMAPKGENMVFKTLDTRLKSAIGAGCSNVPNMPEHHARVRELHRAGLASDIAALMLPDAAATWNEADSKANKAAMTPTHMLDITHQPLCLYMEFLTRLFDARRLGGRRWFLGGSEAARSGLKGRK